MTPAPKIPTIDIAIEAPGWDGLAGPRELAEAAIAAALVAAGARLAEEAEVSILFCDDAFIAGLNQQWRGQNKPTNVLAFPVGDSAGPLLGDIVIAFETAQAEALEAAKPLRNHVAHLLVHGFLHLLGYDHASDDEADAMEGLEAFALARLGIDNPYRDIVARDIVPEVSGGT
jgi:probable rRNA maturation factor